MTLSAGMVMDRLQELDAELQERQNEYEVAAENFYRTKRDFEKELAEWFVKSAGKNQEERRSNALIELSKAPPSNGGDFNTYQRFIVAEASYEAQKAAFRVRETRASIGQSLLRAMRHDSGGGAVA